MITPPAGARILLATKPVDFRKEAHGLAALAAEVLGENPFSGVVVVFRSKRADRITADTVELARQYRRYGYRKVAELSRSTAGWAVNDERAERIWRREGLKVPPRQPTRGRLWLADGSCVRLRPERPNHQGRLGAHGLA
jgi:transposase